MSDGIDELARRLFEAARDERPDAALIARVRSGAGAASLQPARDDAPQPQSGSRRVRGPAARTGLRWLAAAALLGGVLVAFLFAQPPRASIEISAEAGPPLRASSAQPAEPALSPPAFESAAAPSETAAPEKPEKPERPEQRDRAAAVRSPRVAPAPPPAVAAPVSAAPLAAQLELLKRARTLLRSGDGAAALAELDRYSSELHGTDLKDEAELLRMEALRSLGRKSEATALARRFVSEHPDSPLAERAQRFLDDPLPPRE